MTAIATRRQCAPQDLEYPMRYAELPPDVQQRAIERYRDDPNNSWPRWDEVEHVTEMLVSDLEYEFGIDVQETTHKDAKGRAYNVPEELPAGSILQGQDRP
ncbi:MAG: hypothetical protein ACLP9L_15920 [Thermoguttaceae bacterium]